jgi:hypothetical protein
VSVAATASHRIASPLPGGDRNSTSAIGDGVVRRPWRAGRVRHRLTPTKWGYRPTVAGRCGTGDASANSCRGEALPRPPRRTARQCTVADTSRPTRSADQPSARLHDRPAVNGRAQSPSRLKPADPYGACTTPIDPGTWAPHSPLQGACGLSPGLQPRAFAADRPASVGRGTTAPFGVDLPTLTGRRVRHRLPPTKGGCSRLSHPNARPGMGCPRCRGEALPRPPRRTARQCTVADTSRPTRSADQPSARLHDRPAVNGFSPGRSLPTAPAAMVEAPPHPLASICQP